MKIFLQKSIKLFISLTTGTAREYLEEEIFPVLLPALEEMLQAAKKNDVLKVIIMMVHAIEANKYLKKSRHEFIWCKVDHL